MEPSPSSLVVRAPRRPARSSWQTGKAGEHWQDDKLVFCTRTGGPLANLVGHAGTVVTEKVYRHQLRPVITKGAEAMNTIFKKHATSA
jgi:hypothetical protein